MTNNKPRFEKRPTELKARRPPEALALVENVRHSELLTFDDRLADIERTERSGYDRHLRVGAELLAGGTIGAWLTGANFYPAVLALAVATALYLASMAVKQAHADSIGALRRDWKRVMDFELIEVDSEADDAEIP